MGSAPLAEIACTAYEWSLRIAALTLPRTDQPNGDPNG